MLAPNLIRPLSAVFGIDDIGRGNTDVELSRVKIEQGGGR
jgi:hypothetical protein